MEYRQYKVMSDDVISVIVSITWWNMEGVLHPFFYVLGILETWPDGGAIAYGLKTFFLCIQQGNTDQNHNHAGKRNFCAKCEVLFKKNSNKEDML